MRRQSRSGCGGDPPLERHELSTESCNASCREVEDWFLGMIREHEEFEVETAVAEEPPMPFWSETMRRVVVE